MTSTLLTQINDAPTAAAIIIGGAFVYLKFIKGRVLRAARTAPSSARTASSA